MPLRPFTLFIGRNGSGKSSFIEALQWVQESLEKGLQTATEDRFRTFKDLRNQRTDRINLHLELGRGPNKIAYELTVVANPAGRPITRDERCWSGHGRGVTRFISSRRTTPRGPTVRFIRHGNPVREGDSLALASISKTTGKGAERLRSFLRGAVFLRLSPTAMTDSVSLSRRARGALLDEEGRRLPALLTSMTTSQRQWVSDQLSTIITDIEGVRVVRTESERGYFAAKERMISRGGSAAYDIPAWMLSEGTRRLTALFSLLAIRPRPSLIVIEEIENGLDPWTLQQVLSALKDAASDGVQVILTTHSPFLLDLVDVEDVIHVRRIKGDSAYTPISNYDDVIKYRGVVAPGAMYIAGYLKDLER